MRVPSVYETIIRDLKQLDDKMLITLRSMITTYLQAQQKEDPAALFNYDTNGNLLDKEELLKSLDAACKRIDSGESSCTPAKEVLEKMQRKLDTATENGKWPADLAKPTGEIEVFNSFSVPGRLECYVLGRVKQGSIVPGATLTIQLNDSTAIDLVADKIETIEVNGYPEIDKLITVKPPAQDSIGFDDKDIMMMLTFYTDTLKVENPKGSLEYQA